MKKHNSLKSLLALKEKTEQKLKQLMLEKSTISKEENILRKKLEDLNIEIKELSSKDIVITDHALVQYLSRVMHVDIDLLKKEIINDTVIKQIQTLGDGKYPVKDKGFSVVVKNKTVLTVY